MLPQFPDFKKIELSDRSDVEAHTKLYEPYSDFNFTCLWAWDTKEERMISELNGNLVVRFTDYMTDEPFLSFLGKNSCEDTMRILIDYCKKNNLPTVLRLMPDVSLSNTSHTSIVSEEEAGDFDYILSVKEIVELSGIKFHRRRKNANRFWRENPSAKIESAILADTRVQQQIFETIDIWENNKNTAQKDYVLEHELEATKRLCRNNNTDALVVAGLFLEGRMIGYVIGEILQDGYAIIHFLKTDTSYVGSNEALMQGFARHLDSLLVEFINIESDLGFDNMRQAKMSWRPVKFLKRYRVRYPQDKE